LRWSSNVVHVSMFQPHGSRAQCGRTEGRACAREKADGRARPGPPRQRPDRGKSRSGQIQIRANPDQGKSRSGQVQIRASPAAARTGSRRNRLRRSGGRCGICACAASCFYRGALERPLHPANGPRDGDAAFVKSFGLALAPDKRPKETMDISIE
jgi:hypothetical protein